jgi:hypothetical protein
MKATPSLAPLALMLACLCWGSSVLAATYYVDPVNGLDTNPGTSPCRRRRSPRSAR